MDSFGTIELDGTPRIVVAVRDDLDTDAIDAAFDAGADILELRIDEFDEHNPEYVREIVERVRHRPTLATIRAPWEGGAWNDAEAERLALYDHIVPLVTGLDIELASDETFADVVGRAQDAGCFVIGSFHNFDATPPYDELKALAEDGFDRGANMVKVATKVNAREDLHTLARFTMDFSDRSITVIGMGELGLVSRVFFGALGSQFTYTFIGEPTAPGQLPLDQTVAYLRSFYGRS